MFDKSVYISRRASLKKLMGQGIGLFLGNNEMPMNYTDNTYHFRQDSSFLYFFGISQPGLAAIIDFESGEEIMFGNDVEIEDIIWTGELPSIKDTASGVGVEKTMPFAKLNDYLKTAVIGSRHIHYLPPYRADNIILLERILGIRPEEVKTHSSLSMIKAIVTLRSVKSAAEIAEIEKACAIG